MLEEAGLADEAARGPRTGLVIHGVGLDLEDVYKGLQYIVDEPASGA